MSLDALENDLADSMSAEEDHEVFGSIARAAPSDGLRGAKGVVLAGLANGSRVLAWAGVAALTDAGDRVGLRISERRELANAGTEYRELVDQPWATKAETLQFGPFVVSSRNAIEFALHVQGALEAESARLSVELELCLAPPADQMPAWERAGAAYLRRQRCPPKPKAPTATLTDALSAWRAQ